MIKKKYKQIDHTADFGIHVLGSDPKELFANAALAAEYRKWLDISWIAATEEMLIIEGLEDRFNKYAKCLTINIGPFTIRS